MAADVDGPAERRRQQEELVVQELAQGNIKHCNFIYGIVLFDNEFSTCRPSRTRRSGRPHPSGRRQQPLSRALGEPEVAAA